jgi:hypothetical protein
MRVGLGTALALMVVASVGSCVDNEVTFYIEHMKVHPSPPSCVSSTGDEVAASGTVDLALAGGFFGYYYVTNHAMIREEYDNLRAETDGIIVDGMEVSVVDAETGASVGDPVSEYYEYERFIPPESSDIVPAVVMSQSVTERLREIYDCPSAVSWVENEYLEYLDDDHWDPTPPTREYFGAVYSKVRFIGHTQGGKDLETPEFSFLIDLCCNCLFDYANCLSGCGAFCETPEEAETCYIGATTGGAIDDIVYDCRNISNGLTESWTGPDQYGNDVLQVCADCVGAS